MKYSFAFLAVFFTFDAWGAACSAVDVSATVGTTTDTAVFQPCTKNTVPTQNSVQDQAIAGLYGPFFVAGCGDGSISPVWSGIFPTGLSINSSTGVISGTPTTVENVASSVTCTNSIGNDTANFTWDVASGSSAAIFEDDFESYSTMDITGSCVYDNHPDCSSASFPKEATEDPGYTFLTSSTGSNTTNPGGKIISSSECRGGSGKCLEAWDENEYEKGAGQWGTEAQLLKHFDGLQYQELWVRLYVKAATVAVTAEWQKIVHFFHYDEANWLDIPKDVFNTSESTDGGTICNIYEEAGSWGFRCSPRCSNPQAYKCTHNVGGWEYGDPEGAAWNEEVVWFLTDLNESCTGIGPGEDDRATVWGTTWHRIDIGMKMNSVAGTKDGWLQFYYDDCRLGYVTTMEFKESGHDAGLTGFNGVSFSGNAQPNDWGADEEESKSWYYDDFMICDGERCP